MTEQPTTTNNKQIEYGLYVGAALLLCLIILSYFYWQERAIFADAAYQCFSVIDQQQLAIQVQRFGAALVQAPVLLMSYLDAPLESTLKVYSLTFTLYPLLFLLFIWKVLRQQELALLLVFFFLLIQVHTFFWIQSELIQGCMFAILTMAVMLRTFRPKLWQFLLWQALLLTLVYIHPLAILPFLFLWAWYAWSRKDQLNYYYGSVLLSITILLIYRYFLGPIDNYDQEAMGRTSGFFWRMLSFYKLQSTYFFAKALLTTYYPFAIIALFTTGVLAYRKQWMELLLLLGGAGGWLFLVLVTYHNVTDLTYIESYYLPLGIIVGLPFIQHIYRKLPLKGALLLIIGLSLFRTIQIIDLSKIYVRRSTWLENTLAATQKYQEQRFYLIRQELPSGFIKLDWAIAYEMLLLSGLDETTPSKTIHVVSEDDPLDFLELEKLFPTGIGNYGYDWLNDNYFLLNDTLPIRRLE